MPLSKICDDRKVEIRGIYSSIENLDALLLCIYLDAFRLYKVCSSTIFRSIYPLNLLQLLHNRVYDFWAVVSLGSIGDSCVNHVVKHVI